MVVYGASGFVGALTARYLAEHAPAGTRIALAGRSNERLLAVKSGLGSAAADWPILIADSADVAAIEELANSTKVIATTVGPYIRYGKEVAAACARSGTGYVDLTGEVLFVRDCIDNLHAEAEKTGARIVNSCGYDSIPSDLGMLVVQQRAAADGDGHLAEAVLSAKGKGGFSGGTIDSLRAQFEAVTSDKSLRALLADPYALSPDRQHEADLGAQPDAFRPRWDHLAGEWSAPFVMASYNTRIVRRSNALSGWSYGRDLRYREIMTFGTRPTGAVLAAGVTGALGAFAGVMSFAPTRSVIDRLLPKPGDGPSQKTMDAGHFRSDITAVTESGARYCGVVAATGDPGYKATAVMLGESALALALDGDRLPDRAGVLTPATGIGDPLIDRLRSAGFRIDADTAP